MLLSFDETRTNILTTMFIITMIVILIVPITFALVNENNDWPNMLTLIVEVAVGILIAIIVYVHSNYQHNTNKKLNKRMNSMLKEIERSNAAERRLVSDALILRLNGMIRRMKNVVRQDSKHDIATDQERKTILIRQQQNTNDLVSLSDLKIPYHELARIFDDGIVRLYRGIHAQLETMPASFSNIENYDDNRTYNIGCYKKCISDCESLIDRVNQHVKDHDPASKTDWFNL